LKECLQYCWSLLLALAAGGMQPKPHAIATVAKRMLYCTQTPYQSPLYSWQLAWESGGGGAAAVRSVRGAQLVGLGGALEPPELAAACCSGALHS
jgi:hypothetical protein